MGTRIIIRIVRMTFDPAKTDSFMDIFNRSQNQIRKMPGCLHLELWQDLHQSNVYVTHSHWESETALNAYRDSELFRKVWKETKAMFCEKPFAFSVVKVEDI